MHKITIPLNEVNLGMVIADPVHIVNQFGSSMLVLPHNFEITDNAMAAIRRMKNYMTGHITVYSKTKPKKEVINLPPVELIVEQDEVANLPPAIPILKEEKKNEAISAIRNLFTVANDEAGGQSKNTGNKTTAYQMVKELGPVIDDLIDLVMSEPRGLVHITGIQSYDEYTYHHSLSVSVLSIAIGRALGLNLMEIKRLSMAALLHDIGKILLPHKLITKPNSLTASEYAVVKHHPELGAAFLKKEYIGNEELWNSIKYHHERANGTGYPKGLKGQDIPLFSKIITVADVYDALTSYRPYRNPMKPPADAIEKIMSEVNTIFDFDVVNAFIRKIELYPINTMLEISDKRIGVVIRNRNPMRPVLRMIKDDTIVDLSAFCNLHLVVTKIA